MKNIENDLFILQLLYSDLSTAALKTERRIFEISVDEKDKNIVWLSIFSENTISFFG